MQKNEIQEIFETIISDINTGSNPGKIATYIPELGNVDPSKFGVALTDIDGNTITAGDATEKFSIQSIVKVLSLSMAYKLTKEALWERVGVEPSGDPFNSLIQLEIEKGIPRNPFINAGAIVICDVLISVLKNPKEEFIKFINNICGSDVQYSEQIAASEKSCAYTNIALINLMKSFGNIKNDIEEVMDLYFNLCSIEMTCAQLTRSFLYLSNDGFCPLNKRKIIEPSMSKRINAIMQLCGFYDEAGEFAFKVGLPGKSGVGGGIVVVCPHKFSMAVWSPKLNKKGNSYLGTKFLQAFTSKIDYSIF